MKKLKHNRDLIAFGLLFGALIFILPFTLDPYRIELWSKYLSLSFVAIGVVLMWGYCGILSLGQGIFFALGGYAMAMFLKLEASGDVVPDFMMWNSVDVLPLWWEPFHSFPFVIAVILIGPIIVGLPFAYAVFRRRISGVYIAIVTLALALGLSIAIVGNQGVTGGFNGITDFKTILGYELGTDEAILRFYLLEVFLLLFVAIVARFITRSRLGRVFIATRQDENRVLFSGYNVAAVKAFAFTVGCIFTSIGGALYTIQVGLISPNDIGVMASVDMVIYAAVGGRASVFGGIIGALLVGYLRSMFSESAPDRWLFFLGAIYISVVLFMPMGIVGLYEQYARRISGLLNKMRGTKAQHA